MLTKNNENGPSEQVNSSTLTTHLSTTMNNSPFDKLPNEILQAILQHLTKEELQSTRQVNKSWLIATQELLTRQRIQDYQTLLAGSELWRYLEKIAKNENILAFVEGYVLRCNVREDLQADFTTITAFCTQFQRMFPSYANTAYQQKLMAAYFIQQASAIHEQIQLYGNPNAATLKSCFAFPSQPLKTRLNVLQTYFELESLFATMAMTMLLIDEQTKEQHAQRTDPHFQADYIGIVSDPVTNRCLTSAGLVMLNHAFPHLIRSMIEHAIQLRKTLTSQTEPVDTRLQQQLDSIDSMLAKMTAEDWLEFLTLDEQDAFRHNTRALILAIKADYSSIISQLSEKVLLKIFTFLSESKLVIMQHPQLINFLSDESLIHLADKLLHEDFEKALPSNPNLVKRFTFKVALSLLEKRPHASKAKPLLLQKAFLDRLTRAEILKVAEFLIADHFETLLASPAFLAKLEEIKNTQGEAARNAFLMAFPRKEKEEETFAGFSQKMAQNLHILNMLTTEEITKLALWDGLATTALLKQSAIIERLNSKQLLTVALRRCDHKDIDYIAIHYLHQFTDADLITFLNDGSTDFQIKTLIAQERTRRATCTPNPASIAITSQLYNDTPPTLAAPQSSLTTLPAKKPAVQSHWTVGLTIAGLLLLAVIGIGLIITGIGVFGGLPLLLQVTLITGSLLCTLGATTLAASPFLSKISTSFIPAETSNGSSAKILKQLNQQPFPTSDISLAASNNMPSTSAQQSMATPQQLSKKTATAANSDVLPTETSHMSFRCQ